MQTKKPPKKKQNNKIGATLTLRFPHLSNGSTTSTTTTTTTDPSVSTTKSPGTRTRIIDSITTECVWYRGNEAGMTDQWFTDGCTAVVTDTFTTCSCTHLTSFAVRTYTQGIPCVCMCMCGFECVCMCVCVFILCFQKQFFRFFFVFFF